MNVNVNLTAKDVIQIKFRIKVNIDINAKIQEKHVYKKCYVQNPATCSCENGRYAKSIIDDSVIMCDEIIESPKTVPENPNENR